MLKHQPKKTFHIITAFPKLIEHYAETSVLGKARERGIFTLKMHNPREATTDARRTVDDRPYGGGAGMVLMAEPILKTVDSIFKKYPQKKYSIVILSAKGKPFNQKVASAWATSQNDIICIAGRYEGIDERVKSALKAKEYAIGPYVLTDGDVAAMVIISAVARLLPGVIRWESLAEESHWNLLKRKEESLGRGVEYPHYTRPEVLEYCGKRYRVPKILLSGNHKKIADWRKKHAK
ncbi:MAG: tRNA (guanosine(37)-N1)-methyltransferase TrmD [Parcubacteria group bacterium]|nr:tRNA (guanosine(37)-N1)-methyltransferase TrmD [Parcubacteria group bacterium]